MKKILSALLSTVIMLSAVCTPALAETVYPIRGFYPNDLLGYNAIKQQINEDDVQINYTDKVVIDNVAYVRPILYNYDNQRSVANYYVVIDLFDDDALAKTTTRIDIVDRIGDYPVWALLRSANTGSYDSPLSEINIPDSVRMIGSYFFTGFENLKTVELPKWLETIAPFAFGGAEMLESITIPELVKEIPERAFINCINLKTVKFAGAGSSMGYLGTIGDCAFMECKSLTQITLPESVCYLGTDVFSGCTSLKRAAIPSSIKQLTECMFQGCKKLETVKIKGRGLERIDDAALSGCVSLRNINLPKSLLAIGSSSFERCRSLKRITLPEKCEYVDTYAFRGCRSLKYITINAPAKIQISSYSAYNGGAFSYCTNLKKVTINSKKIVFKPYKTDVGSFKSTPKTTKYYVKNKKAAKSLRKDLKRSKRGKCKIYIDKKLYKK